MSEKKYLDLDGLALIASKVNEKLAAVTTMPPATGPNQAVIYQGNDTADYKKGYLYQTKGVSATLWVRYPDNAPIYTYPDKTSVGDYTIDGQEITYHGTQSGANWITVGGDDYYYRGSATAYVWANISPYKVYTVPSGQEVNDILPSIEDSFCVIIDRTRTYLCIRSFNVSTPRWYLYLPDRYIKCTINDQGELTWEEFAYLIEGQVDYPFIELITPNSYHNPGENPYRFALTEEFLWGGVYTFKSCYTTYAERASEGKYYAFLTASESPVLGLPAYVLVENQSGASLCHYLDGSITSIDTEHSTFVITDAQGQEWTCSTDDWNANDLPFYQAQAIPYTLDHMPDTTNLPVGFQFRYDGPEITVSGKDYHSGYNYKVGYLNGQKVWEEVGSAIIDDTARETAAAAVGLASQALDSVEGKLDAVSSMPEPVTDKVVAYIGASTSSYKTGHLYQGVALYEWRYRQQRRYTLGGTPSAGDPLYNVSGALSGKLIDTVAEDYSYLTEVGSSPHFTKTDSSVLAWIDISEPTAIPISEVNTLFD